ncbi:helix-turn-helix domain-containing protein [Apilactobacillus xinyiensis]|uniref:helix-turn-helix domain-containing protein n=1 Tax=Apilactobacillus xinyiensis TaxID=2841032 RepID=UPI001C7D5BA1|nr:helix-turn-helix transcriptional regulator [Apilactobacillus xinyiensis]MCL0330802.1 helix-turn-helix domain-containing protein [Apilactobacillus xinyiensis]
MQTRLREVRTAKGISLAKLSDELKEKENLSISADALAKYERDVREPKLETWHKLAHYFQVNITYLQGFSNVRQPEEINLNDISTRELHNISQEQYYRKCQVLRKLFLSKNNTDISRDEFKKVESNFNTIEQFILNDCGSDVNLIDDIFDVLNGAFIAFVEGRMGNEHAEKTADKLLNNAYDVFTEDGKHIKK